MPEFLPISRDVETKKVLRKTALAHKALTEFKGVISTILTKNTLPETLTLRQARECSAIENIISIFDEMYQSSFFNNQSASAAPIVRGNKNKVKLGRKVVFD